MSTEVDKMEVILRAKAMMGWVAMRMKFGSWTTCADNYFKTFSNKKGKALERCEIGSEEEEAL